MRWYVIRWYLSVCKWRCYYWRLEVNNEAVTNWWNMDMALYGDEWMHMNHLSTSSAGRDPISTSVLTAILMFLVPWEDMFVWLIYMWYIDVEEDGDTCEDQWWCASYPSGEVLAVESCGYILRGDQSWIKTWLSYAACVVWAKSTHWDRKRVSQELSAFVIESVTVIMIMCTSYMRYVLEKMNDHVDNCNDDNHLLHEMRSEDDSW